MLKVWLYAYALQITSTCRLEQRLREDLALRYLAGATVLDHWTSNEFRRCHREALNDVLTQVVGTGAQTWDRAVGQVAVGFQPRSQPRRPDPLETVPALRAQSAQDRRAIRRWQ